MENAAVFEKTPHNTAHTNTLADPAYPGPQGAHAANYQIDVHTCLRGPIKGHNDILVQQSIHLGDDPCRTAVTRMFGFTRDEAETTFGQIER